MEILLAYADGGRLRTRRERLDDVAARYVAVGDGAASVAKAY